MPWHVPLPMLVSTDTLRIKLLEEGLVAEDTIPQCRSIFGDGRALRWATPVGFTLGQPFALRLDAEWANIKLVDLSSGLGNGELVNWCVMFGKALGRHSVPRVKGEPPPGFAHVRLYEEEPGKFFAKVDRVQTEWGGPAVPVESEPYPLQVRARIRQVLLNWTK
ncbi:hypothetical protein PM082_016747 [Marasmius tenuissimus]|nr:hypothetical protein PM082_016747 [Marasmius tenuissimus]